MALSLPAGLENPLGKRMVWLMLVRLLVLGLLLLIIVLYYLQELVLGGFSTNFAIATVATAFLLSAASTVWMRTGKRLPLLAHTQLVMDQLIWTAVVYVSGGVTSGSTSLYGLTCLFGVILLGTPGALSSGVTGMVCYLSMALAFAYGVLGPPSDQPSLSYVVDGHAMVYPVFSTLMATGLVAMLAIYLSERLRAFGGRLEEANKRAEQAERMAALGRLSAGLAHEIRNPLGSIRGSIELLRTGRTLDEEDVHLCHIIEREADRLNDLVTDMVDLGRPREPDLQPVDMAGVARAVVELARAANGTGCIIEYEGPAHQMVIADSGQMRQVLWNLVRNAIQASTAAEAICVRLLPQDEDMLLEVADQGRGIPSAEMEKVFDAFYTTRNHGVGIGLAVVKQVTESHGFPLNVSSQEGEGTTFSMRIPTRALLAASLLVLLLTGCSAGSDWVSDRNPQSNVGTLDDWGDAVDERSANNDTRASAQPSATATASKPATTAQPANSAPAASAIRMSGTRPRPRRRPAAGPLRNDPPQSSGYRNTYYDFPAEEAFPTTPSQVVYDASCNPIATVRQGFHDQLCVQGSGQLLSGHTVSFAKRDCRCARECPRTGQRICFERLDRNKFPHGRGAMGTAITPLVSVAVDTDLIPLGTPIYIPAYVGLRKPNGSKHDGCFLAEDRGLKVKGHHVDIFTGSPKTTKKWNAAVPSNSTLQVIAPAALCSHLATR